jgi:O-antigen/teichoic acid export membrane protein
MSNMNIGRKDVIWNYAATFLKIGVGVILLPFILRVFPQEMVAIWVIFSTIIALTGLLDFGFSSSFTRNVTYVISGVRELETTGHQFVASNADVDYSLFKGLINAMKWFYMRVAVILFLLLSTVGTYYIHTVLKTYSGSHVEVYVAWAFLCIINSYLLYTFYYDSIMLGKGLIKRAKQIDVFGYTIYLISAVTLILCRFNLIAVVSAQALLVIIRRYLSYHSIYTIEFKQQLRAIKAEHTRKLLRSIYPNALKIGLNGVGWYLISSAPMIIGSLFLPLNTIASYGITMQIVNIIWNISSVYYYTYQPKMIQARAQDDIRLIKMFYLKSCWVQLFSFLICGMALVLLGDWGLMLIKSKTLLLPAFFIIVALFVFFLTSNYGIAEAVLLTKNEVPFYKASLFTGVVTIILVIALLRYTNLGVWSLILAPGIAQAVYSDWKWPIVVMRDLKVKGRDVYESLCHFKNILTSKNNPYY